MIRQLRNYSKIPIETKPKNKYNSKKSAFNFKPVYTPGLVFNPAASIPSARQTPKAFLPPLDPRVNNMNGFYKSYTDEDLQNMPIIYGASKRNYDVSLDVAKEILQLRVNDPQQWTVSKLSKKYSVDPNFIMTITKDMKPKNQSPPSPLTSHQVNQKKRVEMWLRNEY